MTTEKSVLFGVDDNGGKPSKLPTIRQFVKSTTQSKYKSDGVIELVWLPGKFNNFTLKTDSFRIIVTPSSKLYEGLREFFAGISDASCGIRVTITDWKRASFSLSELPEDNGVWESIGESGYRWVE